VEQRHLSDGSGSHEQRAALRASLERIRRFFAEQAFAAKSAHGVAVFSAEDAGLFEAYRLPRSVEAQVSVGDRPHVEPLLDLIAAGSWVVVLTSRRAARILRGSADRLVEVASRRDDVHRWHSQGGWSQARFQRGIEKETLDHVKRSCETLFELYERAPFEHLIVGGSDDVLPVVEDHLHPYLRDRLAGRIEVDVERASPEEVLGRARGLIAETERKQERELLDRLAAGLGTGNQAVAGRDQVMAALRERRVAVLLLAEGTPAEEEIELALAQSAEARVIQEHAGELREQGSIGALLRF
jgi:peptide chain release factor subunit 1